MEISNASLLDEATSAAEAMTMLHGCRTRDQIKNEVNKFIVSNDVFDQTLAVLETRAEPLGIEIVLSNTDSIEIDEKVFGCLVQYTGKTGKINDLETLSKKIEKSNKLRDLKEYFFGEDQGRYILEIDEKNLTSVEKFLKSGSIYYEIIGKTQENFFEIENEMKIDTNVLYKANNQWYNNY